MSTELHQNGSVNKYILSVLVLVQEKALLFTIVNFWIIASYSQNRHQVHPGKYLLM